MSQAPILVTTNQAAEILGVPASTISKWKHRELITPDGLLRGRGRGGTVPLYRLDLLRPLAESYHRRRSGVQRLVHCDPVLSRCGEGTADEGEASS